MTFSLSRAVALSAILISVPLQGQKTSTWEGNGSDRNWTTTENWDTSEDPNGGDTAIVPSPFEITLDANRSVSLLDLRGATGNFVKISGSAQLSVQNGLLWKDSVLFGSGTLQSTANSVFNGVTSFNGWTVTLGGSTTMNAGLMTSSGAITLGGTIDWGAADLTGPGHYTIPGSFTKNTADANHSSFFDPGTLTLSGSLAAQKGVIVLAPTVFDPSGATFSTGTEGRLRLLADDVTYANAQFKNDNQMDITDNVLGTAESIGFTGTIESTGTNAVELGTNGQYRADGATFSGPWLMRGASLKGTLTTGGGGSFSGFSWNNGDLGPEVTQTGNLKGDFVINPGGAPGTRLLGKFTNQGYVTQNRSLSVNEGLNGTTPVRGEILLESSSTWEIVENAALTPGPFSGDREPVIEIRSDGTLTHSGGSASSRSNVSLKSILDQGGTVRNNAGLLDFTGSGNVFDGIIKVNNSDGRDAKIRLSGQSKLAAKSIDFEGGGVFELAESSPGTTFFRLSTTGTGEVILEKGTLKIEPEVVESSIFIGGSEEDGLGDGGIMRIKGNAFAPTYAIEFLPFQVARRSGLQLSGLIEWTGRSIGIDLQADDPIPSKDERGEFVINSDGSLSIPSGSVSMNDINVFNLGTIRHGDSGTSPGVTLRRVAIDNSGEWLIDGNGNVSSPLGADSVLLKNPRNGVVRKISGTGTASYRVTIDNSGLVESSSGTLSLSGPIVGYDPATKTMSKGRWVATDGGVLRFGSIDTLEHLQGSAPSDATTLLPPSELISVDGTLLSLWISTLPSGESQILNQFNNPLLEQSGLTVSGNARLEVVGDGVLTITIGGDLIFRDSALLGGDGHITAPTIRVDSDSWLSPGQSPGTLTLTGDLEMMDDSRYFFEASSTASDQVVVNGDVNLSGFFVPMFLDGYTPAPGTSFIVLSADSITGDFQGQNLGFVDEGISFSFQNTGTHLIATVGGFAPTNFNTWLSNNLFPNELADSTISDAEADPDGDGIPNLWEYFSGTSARLPDATPWEFTNIAAANGTQPASVDVTFRWRANISDYDFAIERTDDLSSIPWVPGNLQILADQTVNGIREITVSATATDADATKEFFRLTALPQN